MIELGINLDNIPYEKQRVIAERLEELDDVHVISAVLTNNINTTHVTFKRGRGSIENQVKQIINVLRKYKIYKTQMPTWDNPCWSWDIMQGKNKYTLFLAKRS